MCRARPVAGAFHADKPMVGGRIPTGQLSSSLFSWSHSRFVRAVEFGLHHHEGANSHYDTATGQWVALHAGDVQIVRSGSGISHYERMDRGSRAFQIWFDAGYQAALQREPSSTDHPASDFTSTTVAGLTTTDLVGGAGPVHARTEGLLVRRFAVAAGTSALVEVGDDRFSAAYVICGTGSIEGAAFDADDAVLVDGLPSVEVVAGTSTELFVVSVPAHPSYPPVRQR